MKQHSTFNFAGSMQLAENQNTSVSKNLMTEVQSNGLDCKSNSALSSIANRQQAIVNKSVNGAQNGLMNGKATFAERCNINGDGQEPEIRNGDTTMRPDESLRESQKNGFDNRF